jgi:hypothetical protein
VGGRREKRRDEEEGRREKVEERGKGKKEKKAISPNTERD